MKNRVNIPLLVAVCIPIAMVVFVAASIYLPTLFLNPKYDFLYTAGGYYSPIYYQVVNGKLEQKEYSSNTNYYNGYDSRKLFVYDVSEGRSREIGFDEAKQLNLDSDIISEDGFEVTQGTNSYGFFPFFYSGSSRDQYYLKNKSFSKQLNLNTAGNYNGYSFLGWIK